MGITRKSRFELWPEGSETYISLHNDEREAIEGALGLGPGTHEIKIKGQLYLEVVNPDGVDVGLARIDIDGVPHIKATALSITVNGAERDIVFPVSSGDAIAFTYNGTVAGSIVV